MNTNEHEWVLVAEGIVRCLLGSCQGQDYFFGGGGEKREK
jgi:hypothetical protein